MDCLRIIIQKHKKRKLYPCQKKFKTLFIYFINGTKLF